MYSLHKWHKRRENYITISMQSLDRCEHMFERIMERGLKRLLTIILSLGISTFFISRVIFINSKLKQQKQIFALFTDCRDYVVVSVNEFAV